MDANRKAWNEQQQRLQQMLTRLDDPAAAIDCFLRQHAMVHTAAISDEGLWSFEDEIWQGLTEADARRIPPNGEHSIAWTIWHIARIEDVTMNGLVSGGPQVFQADNWQERLNVTCHDTGNAMEADQVAALSAALDLAALRAYRLAVGRRTREIVRQLEAADLKRKPHPDRLRQVLADGTVPEAAREIVDYWSRRTIAGLLLMPATRHNFVHLNEALRLKHQRPRNAPERSNG
ncbi:MAG: DinB family protein [Chloroflexi bacterium]|nr:DinB family protein [Chloroflexota bacterium]